MIIEALQEVRGDRHVTLHRRLSLPQSVIYPLVYPPPSHSDLFAAPRGVLLYGPPGCGKTHLAKAMASASGATFISIRASSLQDKWYGESNKLVSALFSLARKLQPSIIFIDEIDAFLHQRTGNDHELSTLVKAEFMTERCNWARRAPADFAAVLGRPDLGPRSDPRPRRDQPAQRH